MNNISKLFELARSARRNAYAPYSNFAVGVALLSQEGNFYKSCNVENISYPCGSCAETGAIAAMVAGGDKQIAEILVLAEGSELITPCGACRHASLSHDGRPNFFIREQSVVGLICSRAAAPRGPA